MEASGPIIAGAIFVIIVFFVSIFIIEVRATLGAPHFAEVLGLEIAPL